MCVCVLSELTDWIRRFALFNSLRRKVPGNYVSNDKIRERKFSKAPRVWPKAVPRRWRQSWPAVGTLAHNADYAKGFLRFMLTRQVTEILAPKA